MRTVLGLTRACHPEPTAAVTVAAAVLAVATGHSAVGVLAVAATILASQLAVGWSNDAVDAARDAAGPGGRPGGHPHRHGTGPPPYRDCRVCHGRDRDRSTGAVVGVGGGRGR